MDTIPELIGLLEYNLERVKYYAKEDGMAQARRILVCLRSAADSSEYPARWIDHLVKYSELAVETLGEEEPIGRTLKNYLELSPTEMLAFAASPFLHPVDHDGSPGSSRWVK